MEPVQEPSPEERPRRWLPVVVAVVLVVDAAAAIGTAFYQAAQRPAAESERHRPEAPAHARGAVPPVRTPSADRAERSRLSLVRALLDRRARAVRTGDRDAFLATVAAADPAFLRQQRRLFGNLSRLPLGTWEYTIASSSAAPGHSRKAEGASANVWTPRLTLRYRFRGFDEHVITSTRYLTFVYGVHGWRITGMGDRTDREIWDQGGLRVVRRGDALVLGVETGKDRLRGIAARMNRAIPAVSGVWGEDWQRRVVVLVPGTQRQARALSPGTPGSPSHGNLDQITAIATVASGPDGVPPPGTGDRVIVNPANFSELSDLGRRVVLTHELTHVATRASTGRDVPMWLVEGFADYVGYRSVDLPPSLIARELGATVRSGKTPRHLPTRSDFARDAEHLTRAYESSWLACELIAKRHGQQRLVRLYRTLGSGADGPAQQVRTQGLREVLGTTPGEFTAAWRAYVRATLR